MTKYRIVPIVYANDTYHGWKVQSKLKLLPIWTDIINGYGDTMRFSSEKSAEDFVVTQLEKEKRNAEHLAKPIKEFGR